MRHLTLSIAIAVVTSSLLVSEVQSAPGGRGGGARGGGAGPRGPGGPGGPGGAAGAGRISGADRSIHPQANTLQNRAGAGTRTPFDARALGETRTGDLQGFLNNNPATTRAQTARESAASTYPWAENRAEPFSPAWYAEHPQVWQATHPHADVAAAAATVGLATWLAAPLVVATTGTSSTTVSETVVTTDGTPTTADSSQPVASADSGDWLPLGLFTLKPNSSDDATRLVQLAVDRQGNIRGSHLDLLTEQVSDVLGTVQKPSLQASWSIGAARDIRYEAPFANLQGGSTAVTVRYSNGKSAVWQLSPASR